MELSEKERSALLLVLEHIDLSDVASHDKDVAEAVATLEAGLYPTRVAASVFEVCSDIARGMGAAGALPAVPDLRPGEKSVYLHFCEKLGEAPQDDSLTTLGVDTNCGCDCVRAIDAAADLMQHLRNAATSREEEAQIVAITNKIVEVYWRG